MLISSQLTDDSYGGRLRHQQLPKPPPSPTAGSHPPQSPGDVPQPTSTFARIVNKFIITRSDGENPVPGVPSPGIALGISRAHLHTGSWNVQQMVSLLQSSLEKLDLVMSTEDFFPMVRRWPSNS